MCTSDKGGHSASNAPRGLPPSHPSRHQSPCEKRCASEVQVSAAACEFCSIRARESTSHVRVWQTNCGCEVMMCMPLCARVRVWVGGCTHAC
jgi:hypothetical protein